jgi:hypothetical protein
MTTLGFLSASLRACASAEWFVITKDKTNISSPCLQLFIIGLLTFSALRHTAFATTQWWFLLVVLTEFHKTSGCNRGVGW